MLMAGGAIMVIGTVVLGSSYMIAQLIAGRIITGFGNGMTSSTAPVYQSECSPAWIGGALLTLQGTVTILGVVIAYCGAVQCTYLVGSAIPFPQMDRFGRRTLLMVCSAGLCLFRDGFDPPLAGA
ncbi:hypothetical protein IFM62136_04682 [Aspergillus lentulus]|nr:hypothetical protein IFM62136_04682 [Aspergillus lentulus]